jgi:hypothetical protein
MINISYDLWVINKPIQQSKPRLQVTYTFDNQVQIVVCLARGPWPLPNWVLQIVRSWVSSFGFQYLLASLRSSNSCLRLLPRLLVPLVFPSMMRFIRQFLCNMCPVQLAFLRLIVWRMFLSSFILCARTRTIRIHFIPVFLSRSRYQYSLLSVCTTRSA